MENIKKLQDYAQEAGFESSPLEDEGKVELLLENVVVGKLSLLEDGSGYKLHSKSSEGAETQELDQKDVDDVKVVLLSTWKDWNWGYNPEDFPEESRIEDRGEYIEVSTEGGDVHKYRLTDNREELALIVDNFQKKTLFFEDKFYVFID